MESRPIAQAGTNEFAVSIPGTVAAARITPPEGDPLFVVSLYAQWRRPLQTRPEAAGSQQTAPRIGSLRIFRRRSSAGRGAIASLLQGDLNILHGYGDYGSPYWAARYRTVFDRMEALGLPFAGPRHPNGRQANPMAGRATARQQERADIPHYSAEAGNRHPSAGLRFRVSSPPGFDERPRTERSGASGGPATTVVWRSKCREFVRFPCLTDWVSTSKQMCGSFRRRLESKGPVISHVTASADPYLIV